MLASIVDHLWQSIAFGAVVLGLSYAVRRNSAALRTWLWRIAALKFLVPFSLLFAFGAWMGFPVRHSAIPPPASVAQGVSRGMSVAAPAQTFGWPTWLLVIALVVALAASALVLWRILAELRSANAQRAAEAAQLAADWNFRPTPLGFLQSALLAAAALFTISLPVIAGATRDRQWRQEILAMDQQQLLSARITMNEAPPNIGILTRVTADGRGVLIHNINIQDLVSMVYGIGKFEVFGGALPWLEYPRYDVRVTGPLRAPEVFDPYSLRQPMTNYLYERFGVSIRVNGSCQQPCKNQESFVIERLPRCTHLLSAHPGCG